MSQAMIGLLYGMKGNEFETVTLNTDFPKGVSNGLYVGTTGNLSITTKTGNVRILPNITGGMIHPISCIRVNTTGTTATGLLAVY